MYILTNPNNPLLAWSLEHYAWVDIEHAWVFTTRTSAQAEKDELEYEGILSIVTHHITT